MKPPVPCAECERPTLPERYLRAHPELRASYTTYKGHGLCLACLQRRNRAGKPTPARSGPERPIPDVIEDIEWLLGTDNPQNIAARVGYPRVESLVRRLERNGRPDLARIFERERAS